MDFVDASNDFIVSHASIAGPGYLFQNYHVSNKPGNIANGIPQRIRTLATLRDNAKGEAVQHRLLLDPAIAATALRPEGWQA